MTPANLVAEMDPTVMPERIERDWVRSWHELEHQLLVSDSDHILADALTPQAVVLLPQVVTDSADPLRPAASAAASWSLTAIAPAAIRATQRSPPRHRNHSGRELFSMTTRERPWRRRSHRTR